MTNKIKNNKYNQGQIAIIVLLASAILLTLGLSSSRKTITDTKIDTDEEALKEAFNTAESGINNYLLDNTKTQYTTEGGVANIKVEQIGGGTTLVSEGKVIANNNQVFWLVSHKDDGTVDTTNYYKGTSFNVIADSSFRGALKVDYFYLEAGVYKVQRLGCRYDGGTNNAFAYGFSDSTSCFGLTTVGRIPLLVSVTPLGGDTSLTIIDNGSNPFPRQGEELTAVGTVGNSIKTQVKTRNVYQLPSFFLESATAQNTIR